MDFPPTARPCLAIVLAVCALALAQRANGNMVAVRKAFAQELAKDIARSGVKKVYVPDFTGSGGGETALGRFFAATFAQMLWENAKDFVVVSRIDAHRYLSQNGRTDRDLAGAEVLAKLVSDLAPDAILWGNVSVNQDVATINLVLRDASRKELAQRRYEEKLDSHLRADFEAGQSGSDFYFPGLDGVSLPTCVYCPNPYWPVGQGNPSREGNVVLSILVTLDGKADQMSVAESLDPAYDRATLDGVRTWRFEPARDADGKPVLVRIPVQVTFKRRWQVR